MIGERSYYKKIQLTLDAAKAGKSRTPEELESYIVSLNPLNFSYPRKDRDSGKRILQCSTKSVRRVVKLCKDIGLIGDKGNLTNFGMKALDQNRFEKILSKQIIAYLNIEGITLGSIVETITNNMLKAEPFVLPTSAAIWDQLGQPINIERFTVLLTLLGQCKTINSSQRKIFLP